MGKSSVFRLFHVVFWEQIFKNPAIILAFLPNKKHLESHLTQIIHFSEI